MDLDKLDNVDTTELDNAPDLEDLVYEDPDKNNEPSNEEDITSSGSDEESNEDNEIDEVFDNDTTDTTDDTDTDTTIEETTDTEPENNNVEDGKILIDFGDGKIEVNDIDELKTIASKALKDKTRLDRNKEQLAILEGIKEQGLSEQDLYLLVEAKKGNKQALAKLLKDANVDPYEIDPEELDVDEYKPKEYKADPKVLEVKSIIDDVKQNDTAFKTFNYILENEFSNEDKAKAFNDPNLLAFIGETVKSGLFNEISPNYTKRKIMGENPISALVNSYDDYMKELEAKKNQAINDTKDKVIKDSTTKATKRKKASEGVKKTTSNNKANKSVEDMTDAEFEQYYKKIVGDF